MALPAIALPLLGLWSTTLWGPKGIRCGRLDIMAGFYRGYLATLRPPGFAYRHELEAGVDSRVWSLRIGSNAYIISAGDSRRDPYWRFWKLW